MTEQELIDAGFEKQESNHLESGNGYDYYYYILDLCEGVCLLSCDSDEVVDDKWYIKSFDIPSLTIKTTSHLKEFLELVRTLTGCENV
jgi:hypothetical protein